MLYYIHQLAANCVCLLVGAEQVVYREFIRAVLLQTAGNTVSKSRFADWYTKMMSFEKLKSCVELRGTAKLVMILCHYDWHITLQIVISSIFEKNIDSTALSSLLSEPTGSCYIFRIQLTECIILSTNVVMLSTTNLHTHIWCYYHIKMSLHSCRCEDCVWSGRVSLFRASNYLVSSKPISIPAMVMGGSETW